MPTRLHPRAQRTYQTWLRQSVLSAHVDSYCAYLSEHGYASNTVGFYLHSVAHFSHWLEAKGFGLADIDEVRIRQFVVRHLPACRCADRCQHTVETIQASLGHLLRVLRTKGCIPLAMTALSPAVQQEIDRFDQYLDRVCGLRPATRSNRRHYVSRFLNRIFKTGPVALSYLKPRDIRQFLTHTGEGCTRGTIHVIASCIRSYLRFRAFQGDLVQGLISAVPRVPHWRLASLPKALTDAELQQFLASFDRTTQAGRRDFAMARCLVDLGLRAGEVANLKLGNIDWREGTLKIVGSKGGRASILPLPVQTGRALVEYVRHGRPQRANPSLFLRRSAPQDRPLTSTIVRYVMRCAYRRSGLSKPWSGTHSLRHSVACRLINAGASLKEIADVLRHKSLEATTIYTKVDRKRLDAVALPWPESRS
jgi:integrase/recombinase XerD